MANRNNRPVMFAFEPNLTHVFAMINFGAAGAPSLATNAQGVSNSKGVCNIALVSTAVTGSTTNTSTSVTSVSSFAGLYVGQSITGAGIPAATTIAAMNAGAGTITLSAAATATAAGVSLTVSGGQYTITFGSQFTPFKRLDPYVRLSHMKHIWDESGLQGGASTGASAPAAPALFIVANNISNASLASITFQVGSGSGASFVSAVPASGEILRLSFDFVQSTAI